MLASAVRSASERPTVQASQVPEHPVPRELDLDQVHRFERAPRWTGREHDLGTFEAWWFDFGGGSASGAGRGFAAGLVCLHVLHDTGVAWWWTYLAQPDRLVVVRDHEVRAPRASVLEVRAEALWAQLICEVPMVHWSLGLEAFGVLTADLLAGFDDPGPEVGERVAVGLELDWEAEGHSEVVLEGTERAGAYGQRGTIRGELLMGSDRVDVDASARRWHAWGPASTWPPATWPPRLGARDAHATPLARAVLALGEERGARACSVVDLGDGRLGWQLDVLG